MTLSRRRTVARVVAPLLGFAACGQVLDLPERQAVPNAAECSPEAGCSCAVGFEDCDGVLENGCEVNLLAGERCRCEPLSWPLPPLGQPTGSDGDAIVLAMRSFRVEDASGPVGFDLDRHCTYVDDPKSKCPREKHCDCAQLSNAESCRPPKQSDQAQCDGPHGVDNAGVALIEKAGGLLGLDVGFWNEGLEQGLWSVLISVRGYDGSPNDGTVEVAFFGASPFDHDPCNGRNSKPLWGGTDRWPVRSDAVAGGGSVDPVLNGRQTCGDMLGLDLAKPAYLDPNAYVADGILVAQWPDRVAFALTGDAANITFELYQTVITGRLERDGLPSPGGSEKTWRLHDATLGGRWTQKALAETIGVLNAGNTSTPICANPGLSLTARSLFCPLLDVRVTAGGPTSPCDALSFGFRFEAEQAAFGTVLAPSKSDTACSEEELARLYCEFDP